MDAKGLREQRRTRTRRTIQECALKLFAKRGYDSVTVADVAAAADVSSMTVFRYFPTKEDLVLTDEYDAAIVDAIRARPARERLASRIGMALVETTAAHSSADRALLLARLRLGLSVPALRARMWEGQYQSQCLIVEALRSADAGRELELWVVSGACLAAVSAAIVQWAERGGREDLVTLMTTALGMLAAATSKSRRRRS